MIFEEIELQINFENTLQIDLKQAESKLMSNMCKKWKNEVKLLPKLRFYNLFKQDYGMEKFVFDMKDRKKRSLMSQIRYSVLPLSIETGRYQEIPIEYRYCLFCNDNLVESEAHFLLYCTYYNEIRFELFVKIRDVNFYYDLLDEDDKIRVIMSDDVIKYTAIFLLKAFEKRQTTLYR
jgi:hypothetical protein